MQVARALGARREGEKAEGEKAEAKARPPRKTIFLIIAAVADGT